MSPRARTIAVPVASVASLEIGNVVRIGGEWRSIVGLEPHDLDAYRVIETSDGRRWVRSIFDSLGVRYG